MSVHYETKSSFKANQVLEYCKLGRNSEGYIQWKNQMLQFMKMLGYYNALIVQELPIEVVKTSSSMFGGDSVPMEQFVLNEEKAKQNGIVNYYKKGMDIDFETEKTNAFFSLVMMMDYSEGRKMVL